MGSASLSEDGGDRRSLEVEADVELRLMGSRFGWGGTHSHSLIPAVVYALPRGWGWCTGLLAFGLSYMSDFFYPPYIFYSPLTFSFFHYE